MTLQKCLTSSEKEIPLDIFICFLNIFSLSITTTVKMIVCRPRHRSRDGDGVAVNALDCKSEGRWFEAQSLPLCCFLRQETLPHIVSLHPGV